MIFFPFLPENFIVYAFAWEVPQSLVMVAQYKNNSLSPKTLKPTFHIIYLTMNEKRKKWIQYLIMKYFCYTEDK